MYRDSVVWALGGRAFVRRMVCVGAECLRAPSKRGVSLARFTGGAVGFIGYEFIHDVEPVVPRPPHDDLRTPVLYFLIADQLLVFDRVAQTMTVLVNAVIEDSVSPEEAYENATGEIERLVSLLEQPSEHHPVSLPAEVPPIPFESNVPKEKFFANVLKAKEYITSGDIIAVIPPAFHPFDLAGASPPT